MVSYKEKMLNVDGLSKELSNYALLIAKTLPKPIPKDEDESNRAAVAKGFLISSSQLSRQIIEAIFRKNLHLAMIGLRTLLEYYIDAKYIYNHPKHVNDLKWANHLCENCFTLTNDIKMCKSCLGGKTLKGRAKAIERLDLYERNYASLCDYSHLMIRAPFLNKEDQHEKYSLSCASHSLCHLTDVTDAILSFFKMAWDAKLREKVINCRNSLEETLLPNPQKNPERF